MGRPTALRAGVAGAARGVGALLAAVGLLALHPSPARAGCCDLPVEDTRGCFDTDDEALCELEFGGTLIPGPAICNYSTTPPSCSAGDSSTTTTSTTLGVTSTLVTTTTTTPPDPAWPGFTDGRLNPDPGEYYSVWCANDQVNVWRAVPTTELLKTIPVLDVISLAVGGELSLGDFMVAARSSTDVVTIFGSNGNRAPEAGSKSFGLDECIERNGGVPDASTGPAQDEPSTPEEETEREAQERRLREHREALDFCYDSYSFFGGDAELLLDCLAFVADTYGGILDRCWVAIFRFEITGTPGFLRHAAPRGIENVEAGAPFDFLGLYLDLTRLRDEVLAGTPGGRRATDLYHGSNRALVESAIQNPAVLTAGRAALEAWAPVVRGLVRGDGTSPAISGAQVRAFEDFLAAVRAGAGPALRRALEREVLLVDPASFEGLTPAQMVERLERLGCAATPTFASLRCRLDDLARIVSDHLDGRIRKRFAARLAKATRKAARAETASGRKQRRLTRAVYRLLRSVGRQLDRKKIVARVPEGIRLVLDGEVAALQADAQALSP